MYSAGPGPGRRATARARAPWVRGVSAAVAAPDESAARAGPAAAALRLVGVLVIAEGGI